MSAADAQSSAASTPAPSLAPTAPPLARPLGGPANEPSPVRLAPAPPVRPKRTPRLIAALAAVALLGSGTWYLATAGRESTDDAQIEGRVMNVAARVSGQVLRVNVRDNQVVAAGDVLVELDAADYAARVDAARADLAAARAAADAARSSLALTSKTAPATLVQAQGGLTAASSSVTAADAAIQQARADLAASRARHALAKLELQRSESLVAAEAVPRAQLDTRRTEFESAEAAVGEANARLRAAEANRTTSGGGVVLARGRLNAAATASEQLAAARAQLALAEARAQQAEAALKIAELNLSYTKVRATRRGVVSRRTVEEGQQVSPDRALMALVPLDDVWVVANFKEDQLAEMRAGQPATVRLDTYGSRKFAGHVESIAGGTGARFALLPPDNATGNFVKVVQRVPVLVRLDGHPDVELRPGMSADVTIRTAKP
jgi:membrane fusion protein, multidrug efflux system